MTDLFNGTLNDSDTNETLTADALGRTCRTDAGIESERNTP